MKFVADFHIHSKYSRAVSPLMNLENLDKWARIKGIKVLGTGDFTHPKWFDEIKENLEPAETGLFKFKKTDSPTRFILTAEISCIFSKGGKVRKIHIILFAPSISAVEKINKQLSKIGNLHSDGRPILGLDAKELAKIVLESDKDCLLVPAHIWTPWFSIFGSKSGFNTIEECFEEYSKHIYAGETGLSSDPKMNWRLSQLDNITLISNSDSHSLQKIGREANVFNADLSYNSITDILKTKDKKRFLYTVEFFPEEGKYHYDGHRTCDISLSPKESKKNDNVCPKCKKPLVIGVLNRVEELADRAINFKPNNAIPFKSLIPLNEIIAESIGVSTASKKVAEYYNQLIKNIGSEFKILLDSSKKEIEENSLSKIAEGVMRVREGKVFIEPGYDGVYGKIEIFSKQEKENFKKEKINQKKLFS
jgi:uncharacterized protein (TIGR00375 family)